MIYIVSKNPGALDHPNGFMTGGFVYGPGE
jgi:hypothetical protein